MNHDCHGDYVPALGMYRCLADSTILREVKVQPETCPNCHRRAVPVIHKGYPQRRTVMERQINIGGNYLYYEVKITKIKN